MRRVLAWLIGIVAVGLVVVAAALSYVRVTGLTARAKPSEAETRLARAVRSFAMSGRDRSRPNPVARSEEAVLAGLEHFADHCAVCHDNDGSGMTDFGQGMFPPAPDLRSESTQEMTDGEIFYIIENGVRFTGMPAFATGTRDGEEESWKLVHFIRRLPRLSETELERMKELNPRPPEEIRQEIAEEHFLRGDPQ
jgi:mono/diheme cytochrome c family protein